MKTQRTQGGNERKFFKTETVIKRKWLTRRNYFTHHSVLHSLFRPETNDGDTRERIKLSHTTLVIVGKASAKFVITSELTLTVASYKRKFFNVKEGRLQTKQYIAMTNSEQRV